MRTKTFHEFEPIDYLINGRNCVEIARLLKDGSEKIKANYPMRVLLVHGIEFLLKAFIQNFDKTKLLRTHDIKKLYNTAGEIDKLKNIGILTGEIKDAVDKFASSYYPDSVKARYKNTDSRLDFSLFVILKELLIQPLEKVIHL